MRKRVLIELCEDGIYARKLLERAFARGCGGDKVQTMRRGVRRGVEEGSGWSRKRRRLEAAGGGR